MIIAITGTPGTGKTSVAKELAKLKGWWPASLNDIAKEEGIYKGYDDMRMCDIVDIKRMKEEVNILSVSHKKMIIEAHYAHEMPCDVVIVLRADPKVLRKRMEDKGFHERKIRENLEAEIMDVIKEEATSLHRNVYEIDTTGKKPETVAKDIESFLKEKPFINSDLKIMEKIIPEFRKPFGKLLKGSLEESSKKAAEEVKDKKVPVVAVGDRTSYHLMESGLKPDIIIIDGKERRKKFGKRIIFKGKEIEVRNPAGYITVDLWKAIEKAVSGMKKGKFRILVKGEEDLAVLPCAVLLPVGSYIFYGQINEGLVMVRLDEKKKEQANALLENIMFSQ